MHKRLDETAKEPGNRSEPRPADLLVDFIACGKSSGELSSNSKVEIARLIELKHR